MMRSLSGHFSIIPKFLQLLRQSLTLPCVVGGIYPSLGQAPPCGVQLRLGKDVGVGTVIPLSLGLILNLFRLLGGGFDVFRQVSCKSSI